MKSIKEWQKTITEYAEDHGFNWIPSDIDTMLLRIHSEVSEAGEAARDEDKQELAEEKQTSSLTMRSFMTPSYSRWAPRTASS
jgi:hypothetical protein